jgi:hypothetical protein
MVRVRLPWLALRVALTVIVEVPLPPAIVDGLKLTLNPPPCVDESETPELKPPDGATVMVVVAELLRRTVKVDGLAEMEKLATGAVPLTVSDTVVLWMVEPLVPVMVTL